MGQPVTTNPLIIMLINMTVVFVVLFSLSILIRLIHMIDPTKHAEEDAFIDENGAPKFTGGPINPIEEDYDDEEDEAEELGGVSGEVIAAIAAAVAACGCSGTIKAVRPITSTGWKQSGRWR